MFHSKKNILFFINNMHSLYDVLKKYYLINLKKLIHSVIKLYLSNVYYWSGAKKSKVV